MIFIGMFLCFVIISKEKIYKYLCIISVFLGTVLGFAQFILKLLYPRKMNVFLGRVNRFITVIAGIVIILMVIFMIINYLSKSKKISIIYNLLACLTILFVMARIMPNVFRYTTEFVYFGEKTFSTMSLLRTTGYIIGIAVNILLFLSVKKLYSIGGYKLLNIARTYLNLIFLILYGTLAYAEANRLKLFNLKKIFAINVFSNEFEKYAVYLLILMVVLSSIYVIIRNRKVVGTFKNKALVRKEKAGLRRNRRWSYFNIFVGAFVIFTITYLNYIDTKEVELSPPEGYQESGNDIIIPLNTVDDGHLHRFSLKGKTGKDIRFLVVKKPQGSSYGLGLDACEICGTAGYFERKDEVVCKRCDVVMNKATIGFKGGCNPIPFEYEIKDGKIIINKDVLYQKEDVFR